MYFYDGKTLYNGPQYTSDETLREFAEAQRGKCEEVYIIWFSGLTWAEELQRLEELSLYKL